MILAQADSWDDQLLGDPAVQEQGLGAIAALVRQNRPLCDEISASGPIQQLAAADPSGVFGNDKPGTKSGYQTRRALARVEPNTSTSTLTSAPPRPSRPRRPAPTQVTPTL